MGPRWWTSRSSSPSQDAAVMRSPSLRAPMRPPQSTVWRADLHPVSRSDWSALDACASSSVLATVFRYDGSAVAASYQATTMLAFTIAVGETLRARMTVRISSTTLATRARSPDWSWWWNQMAAVIALVN